MEKVKLAEEQAKAVENGIKEYGKDGLLCDLSKMLHEISPAKYTGSLDPLNDIPLPKLAKALYIGYEVEPTFEVGDWVRYNNGELHGYKTHRITSIERGYAWFSKTESMPLRSLRYAKPEEIAEEKERIWWKSHNRDVWELREDDILEYLNDLYIVDSFDSEKVYLKSGIERKTNYAETLSFIQKHFKIVCFTDDRKDIN